MFPWIGHIENQHGRACAYWSREYCGGMVTPPDLQDSAVQTVLQQAEALCGEWVA